MMLTTDTVLFFVTVSGAVAGLLWRVEARIRAAAARPSRAFGVTFAWYYNNNAH